MSLWISIQYSVDIFPFRVTATKDYIETVKEKSSKKWADSSPAGFWQPLALLIYFQSDGDVMGGGEREIIKYRLKEDLGKDNACR